MRVLIVEDESRIAADIQHAVKAGGYVPETASEGETAWFLGSTGNYCGGIVTAPST